MSGRPDVVVVGAGLAGLTAADVLVREGLTVRVLEARDRVGGRTWSTTVAGQTVDLGAEHIGVNHTRMRGLVERFGIGIRDAGLFGSRSRWQIGGADRIGKIPPVAVAGLLRSGVAMTRLARQARRLPAEEPWRADVAAELDRVSLADWLESARIDGPAREVHRALWEDGFTVEAERISMLQVAWAVRRSGGVVAAIRDTVAYEVEDGTQAVARALAEPLADRLVLVAPVERVDQSGPEVVVVTAGGEEHTAAHAIMAVPLPAVRRIGFAPALPEPLASAHDELGFGRATTIVVGAAGAPQPRFGMVVGNPGFGAAWRRGPTAKSRPRDVPPEAVAPTARTMAGSAGIASEALEHASADWTGDPYAGGTYVNFQPGQLTRHGAALRAHHGRVHFAAAERSSWPIFMEGAVESGERAARQVLAASARPA